MSKNNGKDIVDLLRVEGVNSMGFGTIPKLLMKDRRLTPMAKLIYSYFCTYAGAGNQAFPGRDVIVRDLMINVGTYNKHLRLLKQYGYIRVNQSKKNGQFRGNIYTLVTCPKSEEDNSPCMKKPHTVNKPPCTKKPHTVKPDTKRNSYKNNQVYHPANHKNNSKAAASGSSAGGTEDNISLVKERIEYDALVTDQNRKMLDSILNAIVDVMESGNKTLRIGGVDMETRVVQERYRQLNYADVAYVMNTIAQSTERIANPRGYLLTVLYNAPVASELYWDSETKYVMREYHRRKEERKKEDAALANIAEMEEAANRDIERGG